MDDVLKRLLSQLIAKVNRNELLITSAATVISDHAIVLYELLKKFQGCDNIGCSEPFTVTDSITSDRICDTCCAKKIVNEKLEESRFIDNKDATSIRSILALTEAARLQRQEEEVNTIH